MKTYTVVPTGAKEGTGVQWVEDPRGNLILRRDMVKLLRDMKAEVTPPNPNNRQPMDDWRKGYIAALDAVLRQLEWA